MVSSKCTTWHEMSRIASSRPALSCEFIFSGTHLLQSPAHPAASHQLSAKAYDTVHIVNASWVLLSQIVFVAVASEFQSLPLPSQQSTCLSHAGHGISQSAIWPQLDVIEALEDVSLLVGSTCGVKCWVLSALQASSTLSFVVWCHCIWLWGKSGHHFTQNKKTEKANVCCLFSLLSFYFSYTHIANQYGLCLFYHIASMCKFSQIVVQIITDKPRDNTVRKHWDQVSR